MILHVAGFGALTAATWQRRSTRRGIDGPDAFAVILDPFNKEPRPLAFETR
jgi:hypothetical protein